MMTRETLAEALDEIARWLELKGENPFKIRAYRQGAETVRNHPDDMVRLAREGGLSGIKGIGEALQGKLHELANSGRLEFLEALRAEFPAGLGELFEIQGLGPKKIRVLFDSLGIGDIEALEAACVSGNVAKLPGFGEKTTAKLLESLRHHRSFAKSFLLAASSPLAGEILELLRLHPEISQVAVAGSLRRAREIQHDLDFLAATREPQWVCEDFTTLPQVASVLACGATKASVLLHNGMQCDFRAVSNAEFPFALQYFTGSKEHNVALRGLAQSIGYSLNEYALTPVGDAPPPPEIHTEADLYHALGLQFIAPELRENTGEIEAAAGHALPRLIELTQLRGTFHCHTTASDGAHSLEEMAAEALDLGLQYLGISDHSKSTTIANGLDEQRLMEQVEQIRRFNATAPGIRIFAGSEVDILKDGSLDFTDDVLAQLDFCVASVHQPYQLTSAEMTRRICRAMEHPLVTMLGHATGRLLLRRAGYEVDLDRVIDCAAETHTIIELNCSPKRFDLDWRWWRRARDKGVLCSINPDAHSAQGLHHLGLGARVARKGWLRREDVLNTRKLSQIEAFLNTPKSQRQ